MLLPAENTLVEIYPAKACADADAAADGSERIGREAVPAARSLARGKPCDTQPIKAAKCPWQKCPFHADVQAVAAMRAYCNVPESSLVCMACVPCRRWWRLLAS
jgi:hypothetical protein